MKILRIVAMVVLAAGTAGVAAIGQARTVDIEIGEAPPPARVEVVPEPREGYVYERGHYDWDGNRYVWRDGRYIEKREGHEYRPSVIERRGEHWHFRAGHWDDDD